jgi:hypothetical protein
MHSKCPSQCICFLNIAADRIIQVNMFELSSKLALCDVRTEQLNLSTSRMSFGSSSETLHVLMYYQQVE